MYLPTSLSQRKSVDPQKQPNGDLEMGRIDWWKSVQLQDTSAGPLTKNLTKTKHRELKLSISATHLFIHLVTKKGFAFKNALPEGKKKVGFKIMQL